MTERNISRPNIEFSEQKDDNNFSERNPDNN